MPLMGEDVLQTIRGWRTCWLYGRYGSGKTALAERLGVEFVERGWADHIVGNFPSVLHTDIDTIECRNVFIILDEAGVWLGDREFARMIAFLRKVNAYVVLSSRLPVAALARNVKLQRTVNMGRFGLPVWHYVMALDEGNIKDSYSLQWRNPAEIFGVYDTDAVTDDDGDIQRWVVEGMRSYAKRVRQKQETAVVVKNKRWVVWDGDEKQGDQAAERVAQASVSDEFPEWAGIQDLESSGRVAADFAAATDALQGAVSLLKRATKRARRH